MRKLIIHIGSAKTGTTSLQSFLANNGPLLRDHGFIYPKSGRGDTANHFSLFASLMPNVWYCPQPPPSFAETWESLREEIASTSEVTIISFEGFFRLTEQELSHIRNLFQDFEIRIVCYLRRQDELLAAAIAQGVRAGNPEVTSISEGKKYYAYLLDFRARLEPFIQQFGLERISVAPYEKSSLIERDIVHDFCARHLKIPICNLAHTETYNVTLSRNCFEFLLRKSQTETIENRRALIYQLNEFSQLERASLPQPIADWPLFSPEERAEILSEYESMNREIAATFNLPGSRLFDEQPPTVGPNFTPYPGLSEKTYLEIQNFIHPNSRLEGNRRRSRNRIRGAARSAIRRLRNSVRRLVN